MPKVSVIVPIYNSEKTLRKCLDSLINQTLDDIEILCLDDECKDNSRRIVDEYAQNDKRIIPCHLTGKGSYGRAINLGIEKSTAPYIGIVETDDWCELNMFEVLYQIAINKDAQIVTCSYNIIDKTSKYYNYKSNIITNNEGYTNINISPSIIHKSAFPWKNLYKKDFLNQYNIRFIDDGMGSYQDMLWNTDCIINASKIICTEKALYNYWLGNENNSTNSGSLNPIYIDRRSAARQKYIDNGIFKQDVIEYFWLSAYIGSKFFFKRTSSKYKQMYYLKMHNFMKLAYEDNISFKYYTKEQISDMNRIANSTNYIKYKMSIFYDVNLRSYAQNLFCVKNIGNHKVFNFLGLKISIKLSEYRNLYKEAKKIRQNQRKVLKTLRKEVLQRKLKVGFLIIDNQKWNAESLYSLFKNSKYFNPCVVVTLLINIHKGEEQYRKNLQENMTALEKLNLNVIKGYNEETKEYINLKDLGLDIIFYTSPWDCEFSEKQWIFNTSKHALLCYIPYAIAEASCAMKPNKLFFESIFKHYIVNKKIISEYQHSVINENKKSLVVTGHTKLDEYLKPTQNATIQKPTIIYAPHFTIGKRFFSTGTFDWNGKFILEYAKKHPEYNWIFKPHPLLKSEFIRTNFMTEQGINNYFDEWQNIGIIYEYGHYFDLFKNSDFMITDSASFLLEYYPTQKPVIRLMSKTYTYNNALTEMVAGNYYQVHNIDELKNTLKIVIEDKQDPMKKQRLKYINLFQPYIGSAADNIYKDLIRELRLK